MGQERLDIKKVMRSISLPTLAQEIEEERLRKCFDAIGADYIAYETVLSGYLENQRKEVKRLWHGVASKLGPLEAIEASEATKTLSQDLRAAVGDARCFAHHYHRLYLCAVMAAILPASSESFSQR